jgi:hypothetical protein
VGDVNSAASDDDSLIACAGDGGGCGDSDAVVAACAPESDVGRCLRVGAQVGDLLVDGPVKPRSVDPVVTDASACVLVGAAGLHACSLQPSERISLLWSASLISSYVDFHHVLGRREFFLADLEPRYAAWWDARLADGAAACGLPTGEAAVAGVSRLGAHVCGADADARGRLVDLEPCSPCAPSLCFLRPRCAGSWEETSVQWWAGSEALFDDPVFRLRRRRAARLILQRAWRRHSVSSHGPRLCAPCVLLSSSTIVEWWDSRRERMLGKLDAHVRFLQFCFRACTHLRPRCWRRGQLRIPFSCLSLLWRKSPLRRCRGGANLAHQEEFDAQKRSAERMLAWYDLYVIVLRRLESGLTPSVLSLFCGAGGDSEGKRRAGGTGLGVDASWQADYVRRYGSSAFVQGDATSWTTVSRLRDQSMAFGCMAGPPCQFYSTARVKGEARSPALIDDTRDMLSSLFDLYSIENVPGALRHMRGQVAELRGSDFGLAVDRPRLFEDSRA